MKILILTEKPSQARDFAKALGNCRLREGYYECGDYLITWAVGHLFEIDDSVAPKRWSLSTLPIFPEKFKLKLRRGAGKQFKVIKRLLKGVDRVILASVAYDEPILIFKGDKPLFTTIGEFADALFGYKSSDNDREQFLLEEDYFCPSFDRNGKIKLHRIRGIVRHKANRHKLFRVKTSYGREIVASEHHSFFALRGGKVTPVKTSELKKGDKILVPKTLNLTEREISIDLLKEFLKLGIENVIVESKCLEEYLKKKSLKRAENFFGKVVIFDESTREVIRKKRESLGISQRELAQKMGVNQSVISLFERGKINLRLENAKKLLKILDLNLPYRVDTDGRVKQLQKLVGKEYKSRKALVRDKKSLNKLTEDELEYILQNCKDVKIYFKGTNNTKTTFDRFLKIDKDFAFFLGVFIADGSIDRRKGFIRLFLGRRKVHYGEIKKRIMEFLKKNKINYSVFKDKRAPLEEIRIYSRILGYILSDLLKVGVRGVNTRRGEAKDIPDILFVAPKGVKKAFVEAYLKSDGSKVGNRFTIVTVSKKIYQKLPYLSHSCGLPVVFTKVRKTHKGEIYTGHTVEYKRTNRFGDLVEASIIHIEEVKNYPYEWIYDLSVETDTEGNFICGKGGVCQHNTDPGREGELIGREILLMAGWKNWDNTYRFWTSEALTPEVVRKTLKNLKPAKKFDSLYYSALARQHGDWIVGINLTRLTTLRSSDRSVWSVGRVQTPTLRLIVEREKEIENFTPREYWVIKATFEREGFKYEGILLRKFDKKLLEEVDKGEDLSEE